MCNSLADEDEDLKMDGLTGDGASAAMKKALQAKLEDLRTVERLLGTCFASPFPFTSVLSHVCPAVHSVNCINRFPAHELDGDCRR